MKKILLVHHDIKPWASYNRAQALKKQWTNDEVDIAYCKELPNGDKYDVIHFLYSGGLSKRKDYILRHKEKVFTTLASHRTLESRWDKMDDLIEIYDKTICCVCHNAVLAGKLREWVDWHKVEYIPNGVDEKMFNRKFVVGFVGAKQGKDDHKGVDIIKLACSKLGLEFKEANNIPYEEMPEFYKSIDCLVIASLSEGCNNPILEALAMNKPVISTRTGIANELKSVITVGRNADEIAEVLKKMSSRIEILEKYTWEKIAQRYYQFYLKYGNRTL